MNRKMPVARDVSVRLPQRAQEPPSALPSVSSPGMVTVMGFDRKDVLFRSDKAGVVQLRDRNGKIAALFVRLKPDIWGFSRCGDSDWEEMVEMYGNDDANA